MDDVTTDEPTINFLSLPENFQLQIFKKLDWKSLVNLKLVCRDFYFMIKRNIERLDRPKVDELEVVCDREKVGYFRYSFKKLDLPNSVSRWKNYSPENEEQYKSFLKERDFAEIKKLKFLKCWAPESNEVLINMPRGTGSYNYLVNDWVEMVEINPNKILEVISDEILVINPDEFEFDGYFLKISKNAEVLYDDIGNNNFEMVSITIEASSNPDWGTPYYDSLLESNFLKQHGFFEEDGSEIIAVKLVMGRLTGSPNLNYNNICTESTGILHVDISKCLFNYNYFNFEGRCNSKEIWLHFRGGYSSSTVMEKNFYKEIFDEVKFKNNLVDIYDGDEGYRIETAMYCQKCKTKHLNRVVMSTSGDVAEIILK
uniref:F-box domain-containing protein n=1 Tax=Strongyloides papillosus TaxID=174720 RepID=A0A0N5BTH8_STREA